MSIQYWGDCFIWGHFCTHSPIEALLKLYCGITGPLAIILLLTYRYFLRLSLKKTWGQSTRKKSSKKLIFF